MTCILYKSFLNRLLGETHCYDVQYNQDRKVVVFTEMWKNVDGFAQCNSLPFFTRVIYYRSHIDLKMHRKIFLVVQPPEVHLDRSGLITRMNCVYYMRILDGIVESFEDKT